METLEGTTVALIHRRRLRSFHLGYVMLLMLAALMLSLPFVRTDVVCTAGGILRPVQEPLSILSPMSGKVSLARLEEGRQLHRGDTLLMFSQEDRLLRITKLGEELKCKQEAMNDIRSILQDSGQLSSMRYLREVNHFQEENRLLEIEAAFLREEFKAAQKLFDQEVIPVLEYEKARMAFEAILSRMEAHKKSFQNRMETEYDLLQRDRRDCANQIREIQATMSAMVVQSPIEGTLHHCPGIRTGSQLSAGIQLGTILPEGPLMAECLVSSRDIAHVHPGMPVKLHYEVSGRKRDAGHLLQVDSVDPDAMLVNGSPVFRVRCRLESKHVESLALIPGMTFSASLVLYRSSLGGILLRKATTFVHPPHEG